jgi:hypothetical protein
VLEESCPVNNAASLVKWFQSRCLGRMDISDIQTLEDEGTIIFRNTRNCIPSDAASYTRTLLPGK